MEIKLQACFKYKMSSSLDINSRLRTFCSTVPIFFIYSIMVISHENDRCELSVCHIRCDLSNVRHSS